MEQERELTTEEILEEIRRMLTAAEGGEARPVRPQGGRRPDVFVLTPEMRIDNKIAEEELPIEIQKRAQQVVEKMYQKQLDDTAQGQDIFPPKR
ncbi:MAG: hypothetical protein PHX68_00050 [Alphaproteobacteria bacterium]|nr:hypothetical protein [Alphaproteobacteria bacterium]